MKRLEPEHVPDSGSSPAAAPFCPRCGTETAGAPRCPECGWRLTTMARRLRAATLATVVAVILAAVVTTVIWHKQESHSSRPASSPAAPR